MGKTILGRLARLALLTFVLCGATFDALFLRGMYYVNPNAENWRLLPYIVPAASYEQRVYIITTPDGTSLQTIDVSIDCKDAQGRTIRWISDGVPMPYYTDNSYEGNTQTICDKGWQPHSVNLVTTDEQGRDIRWEYGGGYTLYAYEGDRKKSSLMQNYDAQGTLLNQTVSTFRGNTRYDRATDGTGNLLSEGAVTTDARDNIVERWDRSLQDGKPVTSELHQSWVYDDAQRLEICTQEDGRVEYRWYDEQGRNIKYESVDEDGTLTAWQNYTDITRR